MFLLDSALPTAVTLYVKGTVSHFPLYLPFRDDYHTFITAV